MFVALYTGLPYLLSDTTYLPQPAVNILKAKAKLTEEQIVFLDSHSVDISSIEIIDPATSAEACDREEEHEELKIKGKTTFRELLDRGLSEEEIEAIIGGELPATGMTIRDFVAEKGLDFGPIKEALQAKVDALGF